ncbi:MAG: hypothetical protein LBB20_01160 [Puniceicoccales bacterium]|jgi:hypothetical protein|nr:hypothetical protein [Puniceicoccales bacterium]
MTRFLLPVFDDEGNKILEFSGEKADIINDNKVRISSAKMRTIALAGSNMLDLLAMADEANVSIKDEEAVGKGTILVTGSGFSVIGNDWEFVGHGDKKFTIFSDVQVFFDKRQDEIL